MLPSDLISVSCNSLIKSLHVFITGVIPAAPAQFNRFVSQMHVVVHAPGGSELRRVV